MPEGLNTEELKAVLESARSLGLDPTKLHDINPFNKDLKTPTADALRMQLQEQHPFIAAQLSEKSGYRRSLAVAAYEAGLMERTNAVHSELLEINPLYVKQHKADQEAEEQRLLAKMTAEADKMAAARGYDPDSKIGLANHHPKFGKYFSELQQQQMLDAQDS